MNVYHISYAPEAKELYLHFWGCNMRCRGCLCQNEIYDCHLEETKNRIFEGSKGGFEKHIPNHFLDSDQVLDLIKELDFIQVIFMGMEPTLDPELSTIGGMLHERFRTYNILLTNGLDLINLEHIDEIVLSLRALNEELHRDYTGISNASILKNFLKIYSMGKRLRVESVLIPDYIDQSEIENIARFIASVDRNIPYRIDAYLPAGENPWRRATPEDVERAVQVAKKHLCNVTCLKGTETLRYRVVRIY